MRTLLLPQWRPINLAVTVTVILTNAGKTPTLWEDSISLKRMEWNGILYPVQIIEPTENMKMSPMNATFCG
jgi:hypothetical protein